VFCVHDGHRTGSANVSDEQPTPSLMSTVRLAPATSTSQHPKQSHPLGVFGRQKSRHSGVSAPEQTVEEKLPHLGTGASGSHRTGQSQ
jgi:hypothetical protein